MTIDRLLLEGAIYALVASLYLMLLLRINPRLFLQDYPQAIQDSVPPKTEAEKRQSLILGLPFILLVFAGPLLSTLALNQRLGGAASFLTLFLNAAAVAFAFNLVDWLVLDWLIFCTWTPRFLVVPGTEGMAAYRDYAYHTRGFLIGSGFTLAAALVVAGIVTLL
jgi:hypothetical protein